jgi:hypothetical protein
MHTERRAFSSSQRPGRADDLDVKGGVGLVINLSTRCASFAVVAILVLAVAAVVSPGLLRPGSPFRRLPVALINWLRFGALESGGKSLAEARAASRKRRQNRRDGSGVKGALGVERAAIRRRVRHAQSNAQRVRERRAR